METRGIINKCLGQSVPPGIRSLKSLNHFALELNAQCILQKTTVCSAEDYSVFCRRLQCILQKTTVRSAEDYSVFCRRLQCVLQKTTVHSAEDYSVFCRRLQCVLQKTTADQNSKSCTRTTIIRHKQ